MELGSRDDFSELLHVCRLDIDNVEALLLDVKVPQVDTQIVAADEGLSIAVHRDAVDVVGVGVGVCSAWHGGNNRIVMCEARKLEVGSIPEPVGRKRPGSAASSRQTTRRDIVREVVLGDNLERLLKDFPQLDRLVVGGQQVVGSILSPAPLNLVDLLFNL